MISWQFHADDFSSDVLVKFKGIIKLAYINIESTEFSLLSVSKSSSYHVDDSPNIVDFIRSSKCDKLEQSECSNMQQIDALLYDT